MVFESLHLGHGYFFFKFERAHAHYGYFEGTGGLLGFSEVKRGK